MKAFLLIKLIIYYRTEELTLINKINRSRQITFEYWRYKLEMEDLFIRGGEMETRILNAEDLCNQIRIELNTSTQEFYWKDTNERS